MKRFLLIDLLIILLAVLAGLVWSSHDQNEYAEQLDHLGLPENALVFKSSQNLAVSDVLAKFKAAKFNHYQLQFQTTGHVSYISEKGIDATLPIDSGQWFSQADFESQLPIVVVGKNQYDKLYMGGNQRYYVADNQYLPVIGSVGVRHTSALNDHIFISATPSKAFNALRLNQVTVMASGTTLNRHVKQLENLFHAKSKRLKYGSANKQSWWWRNGSTLAFLALIAVGMSILAWLMPIIKLNQVKVTLTSPLKRQFRTGLLFQLGRHAAVALAIGGLIAITQFYLTGYWHLIISLIILFIVFVGVSIISLNRQLRKGVTSESA